MDRWFVKALMNRIAFAQYSFAVSVENFLNLAITPVTTTLYNYFCRVEDEKEHKRVFNYVVVFATIIPVTAFPVKFILEIFLIEYIDAAAVVFLLFSAQMFYTVIRSVYVNLYKVQRKQKIYFTKLIAVLVMGFILNCACYTIAHMKEAFALGTLLSAIVWFFLSKRDFEYLKCSIKTEIYLFVQLISFLIIGFTLPAIAGCVVYVIVTMLSLWALMNETLCDLLKRGVDMVNIRRKK